MLKNNIISVLLLTANNNNFIQINKNNVILSKSKILPLNLFFLDMYSYSTKVNVSYVFLDKKSIKWNITLFGKKKITSLDNYTKCATWYERECNEMSFKAKINVSDYRNLLLPYNNTLLHNLNFKQKYNWIHTKLIKKQIKIHNRLKIIL